MFYCRKQRAKQSVPKRQKCITVKRELKAEIKT